MDVYTLTTVTRLSDLEDWSQPWQNLCEASSHCHALMSYEWLSNFFKHYSHEGHWCIIFAKRDERLVGILPLTIHSRRFSAGIVKYGKTPYNHQTLSVEPVIADDHYDDTFEALIQAAWSLGLSAIEIPRLDKGSPGFRHVQGTLRLSDYCEDGASMSAINDYDGYLTHLSKNFKANLNKARNKIKKLGDVQFFDARNTTDPNAELQTFMTVESSGWKGSEGSAILCQPQDVAFFSDVVTDLNSSGSVYFHHLKVDDRVVASNLGLLFKNTLLLWKLGYDDEFKKLSPGNLLIENLIKHHENDETPPAIDLMTNETWYNNWGMNWRPFYNGFIFKPSIEGVLQYGFYRLKFFIKKLVKSS